MGRRLLALGWHNVEGTWCFPGRPGAGAAGLGRQLTLLARVASVVPLDEALHRLRADEPLPPLAVAITFDDGYADNLDLAVPLLNRLGLPATFFLVPGLLSRTVSAWWEELAWAVANATRDVLLFEGGSYSLARDERRRTFRRLAGLLKARNDLSRREALAQLRSSLAPDGPPPAPGLFLDWDGARRLATEGFAIGSHSYRHAILSQETAEAQTEDLTRSRRDLQSRLGVDVRLLAYPNGTRDDYNAATKAAAAAAGHEFAVTTRPGWITSETPPFDVRRVTVDPARGASAVAAVAKHLVLAGKSQQGLPPTRSVPMT